jgi:hypothetical protein
MVSRRPGLGTFITRSPAIYRTAFRTCFAEGVA